jgi:hypothetical protein
VRGGSNAARAPPVTVTKYGIRVPEYMFGPFGPAIWPSDVTERGARVEGLDDEADV